VTPKKRLVMALRLDRTNQCAWRGTDQISLSPKAFSVLLYLFERPGRLVTKQELLDAVWPDIHVTEGVLKRAVLEIRKALDDPAEEPLFIQTLHRRGYRLLSAACEIPETVKREEQQDGLVGRGSEIEQLDAWFEDALESSRQLVFITGEAGLGKTTLIERWMNSLRPEHAAESARVVLARGRCLQQFGSGEPYLPIFEALEQLGQVLGRRLVEVLRSRAPTWLMHLPSLVSLEDRVKLRDEVFGSTRERMLREITDALEALSSEIPLVIALEDLHWSDPSTVSLLSFVARRTSPARLMILCTYRPSDAGGSGSPLLVARNELELHRQCKVLPLAYLTEKQIGEYLAARFQKSDLAPTLAAALHQRTTGNPLYLVCVVDELERLGKIETAPGTIAAIVPNTLQQMFEHQAAHLTQPEQDMLAAAAVAGESFNIASVASILGVDPAAVESLCESLVRQQIILKHSEVVRFPDGIESSGYSFIHVLCRDALYRRVPAGRRSRLHGLLAQAEERLYAADPRRVAGELAGHFEIAGDFDRTIRYLRTAADVATARQSNQEATRYIERARSLVDRLPEDRRSATRMDLLEQRSLMLMSTWDLPAAVASFRELADQARSDGATDRRIRALLELTIASAIIDYRQGVAAMEEARSVQSLTADPALSAMVDVYRSFFQIYMFGFNQEYTDLFQSALPRVKSLTDVRLQSRVAWMESAVLTFAGEYGAACQRAEQSLQTSRKAGIYFDYFVALLHVNWASLHRGDLGLAIRISKDGAESAARNGSPLPLLWFSVRENWARMEAGEFERPLAIYEQHAARLGPRMPPHHHPIYMWLGIARLGNGDLEGAWEALQKASVSRNEIGFQVSYPLLDALAICALARKDLDSLRSLADELLQRASAHRQPDYAARAHRLLAEAAILEGDFLKAARNIERALASLEGLEAWSVEWQIHSTAARVFASLARHQENQHSLELGRQAAGRVAATLFDEPELQQKLLARVAGELTPPR
jgi:predicted ATPase